MTPNIESLRTVVGRLHAHGLTVALGGSGLLHSLGLVDAVRDWDLTTDAPLDAVTGALTGLDWEMARFGDSPYASSFRLAIHADGADFDLIGRFTFAIDGQLIHLPTVVGGIWEGVPVGSPTIWAVAYRLMGREAKADLLEAYVRQHGADPALKALLLKQPLPTAVSSKVESW